MEKHKVWIPNKNSMSTVLVPGSIYPSYLACANTENAQERLKVEEIGDETHGTNLQKTVKSPRQKYNLKKVANPEPPKTSRERVRKHRQRKRTQDEINKAILQYWNELDQNKPTNKTLQQMKGLLNIALELKFLEDACMKLQNIIDSATQSSGVMTTNIGVMTTNIGVMTTNIFEVKPDCEDQPDDTPLKHVTKTKPERSKKYREIKKKRHPNPNRDRVIGTKKPLAKTVAERVRKHREKIKNLKTKPDLLIRPKAKTPTERVRDYRARKKIKELLNKALESTVDEYNSKPLLAASNHFTPTTIVKEEILLDDMKDCEEGGLEHGNYHSGHDIVDLHDPPTNKSLYEPDQDHYEIFGMFVGNELRGLANNTSIVEQVKLKINQAILEGYEKYNISISQQPPLPSSVLECLHIKSELLDDSPE